MSIARSLNNLCHDLGVTLDLPKEGIPVYNRDTGAFIGFLEQYSDRIVMREVDGLSWYEQKVREKLDQLEQVFAQSGGGQEGEIDALRGELESLHSALKVLGVEYASRSQEGQ